MWRANVVIIAVALGAGGATAETTPRLVLHPLGVARGLVGADDVVAALALEAARQPIELVGTAEVLDALDGALCARADSACLATLARRTRAQFALRVEWLGPAGAWDLEGIVVRENGEVVRRERVKRPAVDGKPGRGARAAVKDLLDRLALGPLNRATALPSVASAPVAEPRPGAATTPPVVEVAPAPPIARTSDAAVVAAAPADVPQTQQSASNARAAPGLGGARVAGIAIGVAGVAAAAVGGALGLVADGEAKGIQPVNGAIPRSQLPARISSDTKATAGAALAIGGGVAAAVGLLMIIVGGPAPEAEVGVAVVPGGAVVGLRVELR